MSTTFRTMFLLVLAAMFFAYTYLGGRVAPLYAGTHFLIIVLALVHIWRLRRFNLGVSFSFFAMFFFGFIPLFEYKLGITYNGTGVPRDSSYVVAAGLALLSSVFFYAGYGLGKGRAPDGQALAEISYLNRHHHRIVRIVTATAAIALALCIVVYYGFDYSSLMFRGFAEENESSAFGYSFITFFVRPLFFNLVVLTMLIRIQRTQRADFRIWALFLVLVLLVSPLGVPRSLAGALYIPLVMLVFFPTMNSKYSVLCAIVFAVLLAAPIFDVFRVIQLQQELDLVSNFSLDYLFAGHFDAFYNLVEVVELKFSSSGWQTIGALLFWVPRAIWPDKPVGTSFEFADFAGLRSGNVSFPLTADLYADWGVVGVMLGMFLLGVVYRSFDRILASSQKSGSLSSYIFAIAHLELSILGIYLLRGNFLSSLSFTVGVAFTLAFTLAVSNAIRSVERFRMQWLSTVPR